jgi:hypothetical protein
VGLFVQGHSGFSDAFATLAMIARLAGGDNVVPNVKAPARARNHMIDSEIMHLALTILARVIVADEDFPARELNPGTGAPD